MVNKPTSQLLEGDLVQMHGGIFILKEDAHQVGKSDDPCYGAKGTCLSGIVRGYFHPGSEWWFQGNDFAMWYVVA